MALTQEELLAEMERLFEADDKQALDRFVLDHFKEFPEEVQGKLLMGFLEETIDAQDGEQKIAEIQREGLDAMKQIEEIKASISKEEKRAES